MFGKTARHLLLGLLLCPALPSIAQKEVVETLDPKEVHERAMTLDQATFRLKFHYRQNINQIDADHYWVRLFDLDYNHVCVAFPKEAMNFFKKVISEEDSYKKFKSNPNYYGTSSASASSIYVTARAFTMQTQPPWWQNYSMNSKTAPMLVLDAIGKSASKNISGETKYKW